LSLLLLRQPWLLLLPWLPLPLLLSPACLWQVLQMPLLLLLVVRPVLAQLWLLLVVLAALQPCLP
jgi:hypothetical protein